MRMHSERNKLIGVIEEGTNSVRFILFQAPELIEVTSHEQEITQIIPQEGWVEQNPKEIMEAVRICANEAIAKAHSKGLNKEDIACIGITNQRETTIVWDKITGEPLYNAIVWSDIRTDVTVDRILARIPEQNKDYLKSISGLPISPYFSACKLRWLKDNIPTVRKAYRERRCISGTIDSWLIWNLTGGSNGGIHVTDVTNASRTLLMNIETLNWDPLLCRTFNIHPNTLPEIRSSSEYIGTIRDGSLLNGIKITGVMGNQQASLVGQMCFKKGMAKNTYRNGCFLLCNTGHEKVVSTHGLVTTVAYQFGRDAPPVYALEGSVAVAGIALKWLKENIGILKSIEETEEMASTVYSTGDVYFVPAFTGLYAPYWRKDARGVICGLTAFTTKNHIIRAALEAICFQTRDILEAMSKDCGFELTKLNADGIMTNNNLLMQLQADLCGIPVLRSMQVDVTALGAAIAAGNAECVKVLDVNPNNRYVEANRQYDTFLPTTTVDDRNSRYEKWKMAVARSLGWNQSRKTTEMTEERYRLLSSIPASMFVLSTFVMLVCSKRFTESVYLYSSA